MKTARKRAKFTALFSVTKLARASCAKTAAAAVVAWRWGRAPPGPRRPSHAPHPAAYPPPRPPPRPGPRPSRARPSRVAQGSVGSGMRVLGVGPPQEDDAHHDHYFHAPILCGAQHAPNTFSAKSFATFCATSCAASFTCSSFTFTCRRATHGLKGRPRAPNSKARGRYENLIPGTDSVDYSTAVYFCWTNRQTFATHAHSFPSRLLLICGK